MATDLKISQFPAAAALVGTEIIPGLQNGNDVGITAAQFSISANAGLSINPVWYGADPTGVLDCTQALMDAISALRASGGCIAWPAGQFKIIGSPTYTLPTNFALHMVGAGMDATQLILDVSSAGMDITYQDYFSTFHCRDLSFLTKTVGTVTAVTLNQTGTTTAPGLSPSSSFRNVTFRGSDGYIKVNYWDVCVNVNGVSSIVFDNVDFSGPNPTTDPAYTLAGTGITIAGTEINPPVQFMISNCLFNYIGTGINYGDRTQGVAVVNTNFTGGNYGVFVPVGLPSGGGCDLLQVSNSQFNVKTAGISQGTAVPNTLIANNLFILSGGGTGVLFGFGALFTLVGNCFQGTFSGPGVGNGFVHQTPSGFGGTVIANLFIGLQTAVWFQNADVYSTTVSDNDFEGNTTNILNLGTNNWIHDNRGYNPVGVAAVTPAASPWLYTASASPETLYISASSGISAVAQLGGSILPSAIAANTNFAIPLDPNEQVLITYTGTMTAKKMIH